LATPSNRLEATKPESGSKGSFDGGDFERDRTDFTFGSQRQDCAATQSRSLILREVTDSQGACRAFLLEFAVLSIRLWMGLMSPMSLMFVIGNS